MIPKSNCLDCKKLLWDDYPQVQPVKGSGCVCIFCGCIMEFDKDLKLIRPKKITESLKELSTFTKLLLQIGIIPESFFSRKH